MEKYTVTRVQDTVGQGYLGKSQLVGLSAASVNKSRVLALP